MSNCVYRSDRIFFGQSLSSSLDVLSGCKLSLNHLFFLLSEWLSPIQCACLPVSSNLKSFSILTNECDSRNLLSSNMLHFSALVYKVFFSQQLHISVLKINRIFAKLFLICFMQLVYVSTLATNILKRKYVHILSGIRHRL